METPSQPPITKNPNGRPKVHTEAFIDNEAEKLLEWLEVKENIFIEDFCIKRDIRAATISEFARVNKKFSQAYEKVKEKQKMTLFKGGLSKKFSFPMCALILSHNHGIHQKTEQKLSGDSMNPLLFLMEKIDGNTKELVNE